MIQNKQVSERDLLNMKEEIEQAKVKVNQLEGHKSALMKQLLDEWKCKTVKEAEKKLEELKTQLSSISSEIAEGIKKLQEEGLLS